MWRVDNTDVIIFEDESILTFYKTNSAETSGILNVGGIYENSLDLRSTFPMVVIIVTIESLDDSGVSACNCQKRPRWKHTRDVRNIRKTMATGV